MNIFPKRIIWTGWIIFSLIIMTINFMLLFDIEISMINVYVGAISGVVIFIIGVFMITLDNGESEEKWKQI